jgi:hypothetical protein
MYNKKLAIIVPTFLKDDAELAFEAAYKLPGPQLSLRLSESGNEPATHYACGIACNDSIELELQPLLAIPGVFYCSLAEASFAELLDTVGLKAVATGEDV